MTRNFPSGVENAGCTITSNKLVDLIVPIDFFRLFICDQDRVFAIQRSVKPCKNNVTVSARHVSVNLRASIVWTGRGSLTFRSSDTLSFI